MIIIYRDDNAHSIFIKDSNGAQFINSLQAVSDNGKVSIKDSVKGEDLVTEVAFDQFVKQDEITLYGSDLTETVNALNVEFTLSGSSTGESPRITSPLTINLVEGEVLNYELTVDYGVGYEWDLSNVPGVVTVEGNPRKLIGGTSLSVGTYNIPVKAINYNGEDSQTIVLTVSTLAFANTKSVRFKQEEAWLGANAALLDSVLGRTGNGCGSSDAWSIAFWLKTGDATSQVQTVFYFGADDIDNENHIRITWNGADNSKEQLILAYGSLNNNLKFTTPVNSVPGSSTWKHFLITYDGGTTGGSSESINDYYSRFKIFKNGTQLTTTNSNTNYGITSALIGQNLRVGRYYGRSYMKNACKVDELAIWNSDQSTNVSNIYNSGTPFDLSTLDSQPNHWWRMGDGDTFPYLQDSGTSANCVFQMYNMTVADIVSDVP